jgi:hypothetical protein
VFPARLGQLPWEALAPFSTGLLTLERPVSLRRWRTGNPPPPLPPANTRPQGWGVFYDGDPQSMYFGRAEAQDSVHALRTHAWGNTSQLTAFDVLHALDRQPYVRLIFHGTYHPADPRLSHLDLRQPGAAEQPLPRDPRLFRHLERSPGAALYAWTLSSRELPANHIDISGCRVNLSGPAVRDRALLAPIGIGPALIAAGSARVIAPLWNADQAASLMFHQLLYETAQQHRDWPWSRLLGAAKERLRSLPRDAVEHRLKVALGDTFRRSDFPVLDNPRTPFENPYFWAPFILLGESR